MMRSHDQKELAQKNSITLDLRTDAASYPIYANDQNRIENALYYTQARVQVTATLTNKCGQRLCDDRDGYGYWHPVGGPAPNLFALLPGGQCNAKAAKGQRPGLINCTACC
jgi:hypothetical protein